MDLGLRVFGAVLTASGLGAIFAIQRLFPAFTTPESQTLELDLLTMVGMMGTGIGLAMLMVGRDLIVREQEPPAASSHGSVSPSLSKSGTTR